MYHCTYPGCNYETNRSAHLKRHERTHTKERPYKCPFCSYCASRSDHLRRHYKIHGKALNSLTIRAQPVQPVQTVPACAIPVQRAIPVYPPHFNNTIDQGSKDYFRNIIYSCNFLTVHSQS